MGCILDKLDEWLRGLPIEGITGNLSGMFDTVNTKVDEIAGSGTDAAGMEQRRLFYDPKPL